AASVLASARPAVVWAAKAGTGSPGWSAVGERVRDLKPYCPNVRFNVLNNATTAMGANNARHRRSRTVEETVSLVGGAASQMAQIRMLQAWPNRQTGHTPGHLT